jgi:exodeoxyribonuclease V gamma subunit
MHRLTLVTGDSPRTLIAHLDAHLSAAPLPAFDDDIIVVQSLGMERWVRQEFARRRGIAASFDMPFPAAFCRRLALSLQQGGVDQRFEEQALAWRLFALLQDEAYLAGEMFAPLRTFVDSADAPKRYGLARRIAALFDEYRLYRPALLLAWEAGQRVHPDNIHEWWQATLWRTLLEGEHPAHFARWFTETIALLDRATSAPAGLPRRVTVFGISTLPPLFVQLLQALARFVPVQVYLLTPDAATSGQTDATRVDVESSPPHPLVQGLGRASRDLLTLFTRSTGRHPVVPQHEHLRTEPANADTLLAQLQQSIRRGSAAGDGPRMTVAPDDRSLSVQVCHSPLRELEVLRDQLLDAFAADATLRPHDILVMVPDVELYAPLVELTFGHSGIPCRVADRTLSREAAPARALLQLLDLTTSRLTASDVVNLLVLPPVRRAVGLGSAQVDRVVDWIQQAGVRWGRDADHRRECGLPPFNDNSWRLGLDRLLAGYAAGPVDALVGDVLPVAGDTMADSALLGTVVRWVDELFALIESLRAPRPLAQWSASLQGAMRWLVRTEGADEAAAGDRVQRDLVRLGEQTDAQNNDGRAIAFDVVRDWLRSALEREEHATGFLTGGVTFCAMKPMRALPFRFIAMLGLQDGVFPRRERRTAFDLVGADPQLGDRDPRADDRQLMLDTLLCAEDRLLLSYVGRSQKDNAEMAPSVVVTELLDYLDDAAVRADASAPELSALAPDAAVRRVRSIVRVEHRLQPFSPAYYTPRPAGAPALFSFDAVMAHGVEAAQHRAPVPPFVQQVAEREAPALVHDAVMPFVLTVQELTDAWLNPSRVHCRRVLQLELAGDGDALEDAEPMQVDALRRTMVQQDILERAIGGRSDDAMERALAVASGTLPAAALGAEWHDRLRRDILPLARAVGTPAFREPLAVELHGNGWTLTGRLDWQLADRQLRARGAKLKVHDEVRAWIAHLVRCAAGAPVPTELYAKDAHVTFRSVPDAMAQLEGLVAMSRDVLRAPVPYFVNAAAAYRKAKQDPMARARQAYAAASDYARCDLDDPYVALLWRGRDPFDCCADEFERLTQLFWMPLDEACE